MRGFVLAVLLLAAGCTDKELVCHVDTECVGGHGEFGLCLDSHCAFQDRGCTGGYRWDDSAGAQANQCVDPATVGAHRDGGTAGTPDAAIAADAS